MAQVQKITTKPQPNEPQKTQLNNGVMVERLKNGKMCERNHMDLSQFNKGIIFASNVEQLTGR